MARQPMQISDEFHKKMKKLQSEIMKKQGKYKSYPKMTREIIQMPEWDVIEKKLMGDVKQIQFRIQLDRRNKQ